MPSIQETLRAVLGADTALTALVGDRIYPGEIPDDEAPTPWVYYLVPRSDPVDDLDDMPIDVESEVEFHALADTYATAKEVIDAVTARIKSYADDVVKRSLWAGSTEDTTEEGYHHAARFRVWWVMR